MFDGNGRHSMFNIDPHSVEEGLQRFLEPDGLSDKISGARGSGNSCAGRLVLIREAGLLAIVFCHVDQNHSHYMKERCGLEISVSRIF